MKDVNSLNVFPELTELFILKRTKRTGFLQFIYNKDYSNKILKCICSLGRLSTLHIHFSILFHSQKYIRRTL